LSGSIIPSFIDPCEYHVITGLNMYVMFIKMNIAYKCSPSTSKWWRIVQC